MTRSRSARFVLLAALGILSLGSVPGCRASPDGLIQPSPVSIPDMEVVTEPPPTNASLATRQPTLPQPSGESPSPTNMVLPTPTPDWRLELDQGHAQVRYEIPLITQHVTSSGAVFFFDLNLGSDGRVFYWGSDQDVSSASWVAIPGGEGRQQVKVEGLVPGRGYQVLVGIPTGGSIYRPPTFYGEIWDPVQFTTPSQEQETWKVGVVGDSGYGESLTFDLVEQMAEEGLDFVLHMGDVVYRVEQNASPPMAYRHKFFEPFAPVLKRMPVYPVVGNHEWDEPTKWGGIPYYYWAFPGFDLGDAAPGTEGFRNEYYAFSYGDTQFLMLNTQILLLDGRGSEQERWLADRLADDSYRYSIAVFHVPPYTSGLHTFDGRAVRDRWEPLFQAAHVPLVLSGHDHNYERLQVNGITYIVSGGGSSVLYALRNRVPGSQAFQSVSHYVVLELAPGVINLKAVGLSGEMLDQAEIPVPTR